MTNLLKAVTNITPDDTMTAREIEKAPVLVANIQQHVQVCQGKSCMKAGGEDLLDLCRKTLKDQGLLYGKRGTMAGTVLVSKAGCTGLCKLAPVVQVYPQGIWYADLTKKKLRQILQQHIIEGVPVASLVVKHVGLTTV